MLSTGSRRFRIPIRWESTEDFVIVIKFVLEGGINGSLHDSNRHTASKERNCGMSKWQKTQEEKGEKKLHLLHVTYYSADNQLLGKVIRLLYAYCEYSLVELDF